MLESRRFWYDTRTILLRVSSPVFWATLDFQIFSLLEVKSAWWPIFRCLYGYNWGRFQIEEDLQKGRRINASNLGHGRAGTIQISCQIVSSIFQVDELNFCRFYNGANGVVVVFDLSNRTSFEAIRRWMSEIRENCDEIPRILGKFPFPFSSLISIGFSISRKQSRWT